MSVIPVSYKHYVFNVRDYKVKEVLGEGAYGVVALGVHRKSQKVVAIKKIQPFQRTLFCLRTLREIKFLRQFNHPNIIRILDIQKPSSFEGFNEVYVIQEYMDADLHTVIQTQELSDDHIKYFLYQILKGVKYLHSCGVIHRDLKPANLLVNENCDLKICDFGLARIDANSTKGEDKISFLTEYVATRWYRAPEIMLSSAQYSKAIDIWSIGCIVAEMILREPFLPGTNYRNQLALIFEVLGTPTAEEMKCIKLKKARDFVASQRVRRKIPMKKIFRSANPLAIDFIEKTVCFDPEKRMTIEQTLEHPYVQDFRNPKEELSAERIPSDLFFFDDYKDQLKMIDLKRMLYAEIVAG